MKTIKGNAIKLQHYYENFYYWHCDNNKFFGAIINNNFIISDINFVRNKIVNELKSKNISYKIEKNFIIISPKYYYISNEND